MSSVNWKKCKGGNQSKAMLRHNDKDKRKEQGHTNTDIDKDRTDKNLNFLGTTYKTQCAEYDRRVKACAANMKTLRKDAVTMIAMNIKLPPGLTDTGVEFDPEMYERQKAWAQRCFETVRDFVNADGHDRIIAATADFDEIHEYLDTKTKEKLISRPEVDIRVIPEVDGKLCAKKFMTGDRMTALNNALEEMTQTEFEMEFMTGGEVGKRSTESLKMRSKAEEEVRTEYADKLDYADFSVMQADQKTAQIKAREDAVSARETAVSAREDAAQERETEDAKEHLRIWKERKQLEAAQKAAGDVLSDANTKAGEIIAGAQKTAQESLQAALGAIPAQVEAEQKKLDQLRGVRQSIEKTQGSLADTAEKAERQGTQAQGRRLPGE